MLSQIPQQHRTSASRGTEERESASGTWYSQEYQMLHSHFSLRFLLGKMSTVAATSKGCGRDKWEIQGKYLQQHVAPSRCSLNVSYWSVTITSGIICSLGKTFRCPRWLMQTVICPDVTWRITVEATRVGPWTFLPVHKVGGMPKRHASNHRHHSPPCTPKQTPRRENQSSEKNSQILLEDIFSQKEHFVNICCEGLLTAASLLTWTLHLT